MFQVGLDAPRTRHTSGTGVLNAFFVAGAEADTILVVRIEPQEEFKAFHTSGRSPTLTVHGLGLSGKIDS